MSLRRQYSSCDPCRRLKRKCVYEGTLPLAGLACLNCVHLGYKCTFNYVSARTEQKRKKRSAISSTRLSLQEAQQSSMTESQHGRHGAEADRVNNPGDSVADADYPCGAHNDIFAEFTTLDNVSDQWLFRTVESIVPVQLADRTRSPQLSFSASISASGLGNYVYETQFPGYWRGSPIQLLNSTFTANVLGARLHHTYASMVRGMESRYLDYESNPFAPTYKYSFSDDHVYNHPSERSTSNKVTNQIVPVDGEMSPQPASQTMTPSQVSLFQNQVYNEPHEKAMKVTFVGLARFLDHFSHLYGNIIDRQSKEEDRTILIHVQQAFALQWLPFDKAQSDFQLCTSTNENGSSVETLHAFTTAWFNAQDRIQNAKPNRSFTRVYAMLLFHLCVVPEEANDNPVDKNKILNECLSHLLDLKTMVDEYSRNLSTASIYRRLLESSVTVFEWFAYVKDTFESLICDRDCFFTDDPPNFKCASPSISPQTSRTFDAEVPLLCQKVVSPIGQVLRQVTRVKQLVREAQYFTEQSALRIAFDTSVNLIDAFNSKYGQFFDEGISRFEGLSDVSKLSVGYQTLFWNLGVVILVEQIDTAVQSGFCSTDEAMHDVLNKAREYETSAISSLVAISSHINDITATNGYIGFPCDSELKLPFILHHASLAPVVTVLSKAIEHLSKHITFANVTMLEKDDEFMDDMERSMLSIKTLLTCLLGMDTTVAGTRSTRSTIRKLMSSQSDVLMDCWGVDERQAFP